MKGSITKDRLIKIAVFAFWIGIWQLIASVVAQELLVPAPLAVLRTIGVLVQSAAFWQSAVATLCRIVTGFLLALAAGCLVAALMNRFRIVDIFLSPLIRLFSTVPVASFIILALVWLKTGVLPSFISFIMVLPIVSENIRKGLEATDRSLLEMAHLFRMSKWKTVRTVWIPSIAPYFLAACTTGLGIAWKSGVAAEVICRPEMSIGKMLQNAKLYLETPEVFAWTIVIIFLSLLVEYGLVALIKRLCRRYLPQE